LKVYKALLTGAAFIVMLHLFFSSAQRWLFDLFGERLISNVVFAIIVAAVFTAVVWSAIKGHRDVLSLLFVGATLVFLLLSRPVFAGRFSLFLFFLLGILSVVDEKHPAKWIPILMLGAVALLCEWLPAVLLGGARFFWLDAVNMLIGGLAGRLVVCSSH